MKKISVIIPCFNVEKYLSKCLDSILNQTWWNLEVICIDDGSSDRTFEILKSYSLKDARVVDIRQSNKGLSETRNIGIRRSTGEFIMFVDSDDWLELNCIEKIFEPNYDLICFSYNRVFRSVTQRRFLNLTGVQNSEMVQRRMIGLIGDELREPEQANSLVTACAKLYKADIIKKNQIYFVDTKEIGTEDALFNIYYLNHCKSNVLVIDHPYYNYFRDNESSLTTLYKPNLFNQWQKLHKKIEMVVIGKSEEMKTALDNRIALSLIGLGLNEVQNEKGFFVQIKNLSTILTDADFSRSFAKLDYNYFPIHWKLLFLMAKSKMKLGVWFTLKIAHYLWKKKNK